MIHATEIRQSPYGPGTYQAHCLGCVWRGQAWPTSDRGARNEADQHAANPDEPAGVWSPMGRAS